MGAIASAFAAAFRDFVLEGNPASGAHEPVKSDIRSIGRAIEKAISVITSLGVATVVKETRALLNADLSHAADTVALVWGDADDANNDYYVKVGASGSGSWTLTSILHDTVSALPSPPNVWRGKQNLWPDPFFRAFQYPGGRVNGFPLWGLTGTLPPPSSMPTWELVANPVYDGFALRKTGNTTLSGPRLWLGMLGVSPGDIITLAAQITAVPGTTSSLRAYFRCYDALANPTSVQMEMTGSGVIGSKPKLVMSTFAVPANTAFIQVYPINSAADHASDLVALWAAKASDMDAPTLPPPGEDAETLLRSALDTLTPRIAGNEAAVDYAVLGMTEVEGASAVTLNGTGFGSVLRNLPFTGWGERYTPAGISFNAIEVVSLSRHPAATAAWRTLHVVVRTGANSHGASASVVAVGTALVDPNKVPLSNVRVLLRSPVTGDVITLSDASFTGGEYFIGIYVRDADGNGAAMGEINGTMPNTLGSSYYFATSGDPLVNAWTANTGNTRQGVRHLLITAPVEKLAYQPSQKLVGDLSGMLGLDAVVPTLAAPPAIYGLQGREMSLYFDNLFAAEASDFNIDVTAAEAASRHLSERWAWTPSGALTSGTLTLSVRRKIDGLELASSAIAQRAAAASAGTGQTRRVCVIGDSLTQAGIITQTLLDNASGDVMGVELVGTRGSGANRHEGRGGWKVNDYVTAGPVYYAFTVSGVVVEPAINATTYTVGASTFMVQEVSLTGGAGSIICSLVSGGAPPSSGMLTKSNTAAGDGTIAFSASASQPGNPFWKGGAVNFSQYLSDNGLALPDWVVIHLGTNDVFGATTDDAVVATAGTELAKLDTLIASIKAAGAGVKVAVALIPPPTADQDGFGFAYASGQPRWRVKRNYALWNREIAAKYAGQESARVYVLPSGLSVDTVNNFPRADLAPANPRIVTTTYANWGALQADLAKAHGTVALVTNGVASGVPAYMVKVGASGAGYWREAGEADGFVRRQSNGVHPAAPGYRQIGDAMWAFFKCQAV